MYYPSNMTFQYFFFDTYLGNFLQILPIALIVGITYGWVKSWKNHNTPFRQRIGAILFVCYITGLICLVWLFGVIGDLWYPKYYRRPDFSNYFLCYQTSDQKLIIVRSAIQKNLSSA